MHWRIYIFSNRYGTRRADSTRPKAKRHGGSSKRLTDMTKRTTKATKAAPATKATTKAGKAGKATKAAPKAGKAAPAPAPAPVRVTKKGTVYAMASRVTGVTLTDAAAKLGIREGAVRSLIGDLNRDGNRLRYDFDKRCYFAA
jgi:hypothetical protein